jgi:hypothetical protein
MLTQAFKIYHSIQNLHHLGLNFLLKYFKCPKEFDSSLLYKLKQKLIAYSNIAHVQIKKNERQTTIIDCVKILSDSDQIHQLMFAYFDCWRSATFHSPTNKLHIQYLTCQVLNYMPVQLICQYENGKGPGSVCSSQ